MKLTVTLAWRNIWRNRKRTLITISSIFFAILFALLSESVNRGTHDQMIASMAEFHTGYLRLQHPAYQDEPSLDNTIEVDSDTLSDWASRHRDINFTVPRIETYMLVSSDERTRGVMILGVDFAAEHRLNKLGDKLIQGRFPAQQESGAVVGSRLADRLNVVPGDTLVLLGQGRFGVTAAGLFTVAGVLRHPVPDFDNQMVYIPLRQSQYLLDAPDQLSALIIQPNRVSRSVELARELNAEIDHAEMQVRTWMDMMPELLQAIEFDKASQVVFSGVLYIVIGFGLFGTVLMMTLERRRELATLLALGMHRTKLSRVLYLETILISSMGILAGLVAGFLLLAYLHSNPIPLTGSMERVVEEFGYEPFLKFSVDAGLFISQAAIVLLLALLTGMYPVRFVGRLNHHHS